MEFKQMQIQIIIIAKFLQGGQKIMEILVGYSGFVGSNICEKHKFDELYDSKNIKEAYGKNPELLVYSGVPAQRF